MFLISAHTTLVVITPIPYFNSTRSLSYKVSKTPGLDGSTLTEKIKINYMFFMLTCVKARNA